MAVTAQLRRPATEAANGWRRSFIKRRWPVKALFAVLLLAVAACGGSAEREARHMQRGKELFQEHQYDKARVEFRNALKIDPTNVEALYYIGEIHEHNGNWRGALINYSKAVQQDPKHLPSQVKLGQLYLLANKVDKAEEQARIAAGIDAKDPRVLLLQSSIALRKNNLAAAREKAEAAIAVAPDNIDAASMLAAIDQRAGKPNEALEILAAAIAKHPKNEQLRLIKIRVLSQQNNVQGVEETYRELIDIAPKNMSYRTQLARIYASQNDVDQAEKLLRDTIAAGIGGKDAKLVLVDLLAQRRGFAAAEKELTALIAAQPDEPAFVFKLADLYNANKQPDKAEALLRKMIEQQGTSPSGLTARVGLARLMLAKGDEAQAKTLIDEVLKEDSSNPDALMIHARLALAHGETDTAIGDLRTVLRNAPDSIPALKLQADALFQSGQAELGIDTLQRLMQIDPRDTDTRLKLAAMLARRGSRPEALKLLDETPPNDASNPKVLSARAALLIDQKQWTDAEAIIGQLRQDPANERLADALQGSLYQGQGQYAEAITSFKAALAKKPGSPEIISAIARAMLAEQKPDEAVAFLHEQTEENPSNAVAYNLLGELLVVQDQNDDAETAFHKAMDAQPRWVMPYVNLARLYNRIKEPQKAVAITQKGLTENPNNATLLVAHAAALESAGDYQAAIDTYNHLLQEHPDIEVAINNYGALVADFRPKDQAALQHALTLAKRFEDSTNPLFVDTLGWLQYRTGDLPQARANLERAVRLRPDVPQLQYHLGMILRALGDKDLARKALERAVVAGAKYPGLDDAKAALEQL